MTRPEHRSRSAFLALTLALAGCGKAPAPEGWHLYSLLTVPPVDGSLRELRVEYETLRGRSLWAVEQEVGTELVWQPHLGGDPTFAFRPVPEFSDCLYSVVVRTGEEESEILRQSYPAAGPNPPMAVEMALGRWQGRSVDLVLRILDASGEASETPETGPKPTPEVAGEPGCPRGRWGLPAVASRMPRAAPSEPPAARKPNILLVGVDTLRADALGAYGRTPSVTPALDRLAAESDVWLRAYSSANTTNPSFASLMTGLYSKNHGIYDLLTPLPEEHTTLAEHLAGAGYQTRAVVSVAHLARRSGLEQGFGTFLPSRRQLFADAAVAATTAWMQFAEEPFFIWLHLFDAHVPHNPPRPFDLGFQPAGPPGMGPIESWTPFRSPGPRAFERQGRRLPGHADLYTGEVAYLDQQIGRLLDFMESRGLLETTVLALVSDHGETLGERGRFFDHAGLHDNTTHVPLMIRWPGPADQAPEPWAPARGRRLSALAQHLDLFPTLLRAAGIEPPEQDGVDLLDGGGRRAVFSESALNVSRMVRTEEHKYIASTADDLEISLFDLEADPFELHNLAGSGDPAEERLAALLERWMQQRREGTAAPERAEISEQEKAELEALGYVQ